MCHHRRPGFARRALEVLRLAALLLGAGTSEAAPASFRFAWLSDTHVGSQTGQDDLLAAVNEINSITGLSFVVLSGDVTEYGSREQLMRAKEVLDGLRVPCHVIPGNHDTKWSESGATDFARIWGQDRFVFEHGGFRFLGLHQGPVMKMGDGHWAPQDVRWLEATLKNLPDTNQPIVFITHYPIDPAIANWYVVLDLLKRYNTQVVLCGHGHSNRKLSFEGLPGNMGRSSLRARAPIGGFNVVELNAETMTVSERGIGGETREPWHSVALRRPDQAEKTVTNTRPDFSINLRYPNVRPVWTFDTGYTIASTPALSGERVIVGDASGTVRALSLKTGKPDWVFRTANAVYSTPDVERGTVVVTSADGNVYALDTARGRERWRFESSRPIVASPRIARGTVYIGSSDGKFRALDLGTGKVKWEFAGVTGFVECRPLVQSGKVVFGAWDQHLYALDVGTGALDWKWNSDRPGTLLSPAACWPVSADGKIFIVAPDRMMTALDLATGREVWRTGTCVVRESIGISEDSRRVFVRAMNDKVFALSTSAKSPEPVWECNAGFGYDINSGMLMEKDGTVFYGTKNGLLLALDSKTGQIKWQHKFGVGIMNTVSPVTARSVVVTDFDGRIALIEAR